MVLKPTEDEEPVPPSLLLRLAVGSPAGLAIFLIWLLWRSFVS
jgi:hypothetical protein